MTRTPVAIIVAAAISAGLFSAAATPPLRAADLTNILTGYTISSWSEKDGLPSSVTWAVAQDLDGYLWVATGAGLVRFDGVRFTAADLITTTSMRPGPVRAAVVSRDGSLWAGHGDEGGITRIRDGHVRYYGAGSGLPKGTITILYEDPAGTIWAGSNYGLFRLSGEQWTKIDGLPAAPVFAVYVDRRADLCIGTAAGLFLRRDSEGPFERIEPAFGAVRGVAEDANGTLWASDPLGGFRRLHGPRETWRPIAEGRGSRMLHDTKGNLWVGTRGQGLWRLRVDAWDARQDIETSTARTGLSNDGIESLLEDREGNIWAATADGLNRLTPHKVAQVTDLGIVSAVDGAPDGSLWVGTADALIRFSDGRPDGRRELVELAGGPLAAMHVDRLGTVWAATSRELLRVERGQPSVVPVGRRHAPLQIAAIASDRRGAVWLYDLHQGLLRWRDGAADRMELPPEIRGARVNAMDEDAKGRMWLALDDGRVAIVDGPRSIHVYGAADGLRAGVYRAVHEGRDGVLWLGGTSGLSKVVDGRGTTLAQAGRLPAASITAIAEDEEGSLWLALESWGAARIARSELDKAFADPAYEFRYTRYDRSDGFAGTPHFTGSRTAARAADGRLWFVSGRGLTVVDPLTLRQNAIEPAAVRIERVTADGVRVDASAAGALPSAAARVDIEYTVLNLTSPLRTRFRYRLEGFDAGWIDAGTRRQAFYTNLPPRAYEFHVMATTDDGAWHERAAAWSFAIRPAFYQTVWFAAACVAVLVAAVGGAWRLHLRRVRRRFALLLGERARVSREIHDTLLQSMVGVALQFDVISNDPGVSSPRMKAQLVRMRKDIEEYIREARQSIWDLRSPKLQKSGLVEALREAGAHAASESNVRFALSVIGSPRPCPARVEEHLLRIGREAVTNAVRHSRAGHVRMDLEYGASLLRLRVTDDGCGFDPSRAFVERGGHYGLLSMKERAEDVGGSLKVERAAGRGTSVEAIVPAPAVPL